MRIFLSMLLCIGLLALPACAGENAGPVAADLSLGFDGVVIVLDPGHGGTDHGAAGCSGVKEDQLNLKVAYLLKALLQKSGAIVVMTRKSADVDYSGAQSTRKRRDMENRARMIVASNPAAVISIHMNKYPNKKYYGPQTFFLKESPEGKRLAEDIQDQLLGGLPSYKKFRIVEGNFFMLHVVKAPSVLVECGFLSNAGDEKRLQEASYQNTVARCIYKGVCDYFAQPYDES